MAAVLVAAILAMAFHHDSSRLLRRHAPPRGCSISLGAHTVPADPVRDTCLRWVERCVVNLRLCPFAEAPLKSGAITVATCSATDEEGLTAEIGSQCEWLLDQDPDEVATVLIAAPNLRSSFLDFQDSISVLEDEDAFAELYPAYKDRIMVVCFHPEHAWAGLPSDDPVNYEKRAPFVIVNLLRTSMVDTAIATGKTADIGVRNEARLREEGIDAIRALYAGLFSSGS